MGEDDTAYRAAHAAFYDHLTASSEREDVDFYADLALNTDGPVLEAACGTGRIYLELLAAGVDADGFDLSEPALEILRQKAASRGLEPSVWNASLDEFTVDRAYALAICPFNAFQHLLAVSEQLAALECVYDALEPGGRFVFDVFVPSFEVVCERYGAWSERTVDYRGEPHEVRTRSALTDEVEQVFRVENELRDAAGDRVFTETHRLKMLPKREVELLARCSPFEDWRAAGDFSDEPLRDGDGIQVWSLEKEAC